MNTSDSSDRVPGSGALHPGFALAYGSWAFNRFWNRSKDGPIAMKVRAGFDDLSLLDGILRSAKIGRNTDGKIPHVYILFAYGGKGDERELRELSSRFPYSELISNTTPEGHAAPGRSIIEHIRPEKRHDS